MSDPDKKPDKDWNAMFYLAGENNLADECVFALKGLKRAKPEKEETYNLNAGVSVFAQLDAGGLGGNEMRYPITQGDKNGELKNNPFEKIDTTETSYRGVLKDFISSSIDEKNLASHYLLVLSGHGNGIISDFLPRDDETYDKLSIPKIQWVLRKVKEDLIEKFGEKFNENSKFDILGLDSCMMSMAEIAYELRNHVTFMVGAEGFEPNAGWPYEQILSDILSNTKIEPKALATLIVERYVNYYTDYLPAARSVDLAACDLTKCDDLKEAIKEFADVLIAKLSDEEHPDVISKTARHLVLAHWEAQSYKDDQYVDLYDFCDLLDRGPDEPPKPTESPKSVDPSKPEVKPVTGSVVMRNLEVDDEIRARCQRVKEVLTGMVLKSCYSGPAVQYSHGLSVYFPWANVIDTYKDLEFAKATNWETFLHKYIEVTRRSTRICPFVEEQQPVVKGKLFFNTVVGGYDYLWTENKNAPTVNRFLGNKVGSMKNPAIDYVPCHCPETKQNDSGSEKDDVKATEPEPEESKE